MTDLLSQSIDQLFDEPWYQAKGGASPLVPALFQVSIAGHPYVITASQYDRVTVPLQRQATDESVEPGEQSLDIVGAWRRSQDNWFLGAGQEYLDNRFGFISVYVHSGETPSVRTRFWRSKGVNPWTEGALSLLDEYHKIKTGTTNPQVVAVGTDLFYWDGTALHVSVNPTAITPTWANVTAPTGGTWPTVHSMTTDGASLYLALGAHGVAKVAQGATSATTLRPSVASPKVTAKGTTGSTTYAYAIVATDANGFKSLVSTFRTVTNGNASLSTTNYNEVTWTAVAGAVSYDVLRGTSGKAVALGVTLTSFTDKGAVAPFTYTAPTTTTKNLQATFVAYANSFLLASAGPLLVTVGANGTTTKVLDHFNADFTWNAACPSPGVIYVAGHAGNVSEIYGTLISTTTFALTPPFIAGQVTNGEIVNAMTYYEGMVILATSLGVRAASAGSNNYLTTGPVISNLGASECCVPWATYVWFGVSDFAEDDGIYSGTAVSSGTGRLFLSEFSNPLLPAYTSDVLAPNGTTGTTTSVAVCRTTVFFAITGKGLYAPDGDKVAYGYLEAGWVRYGTVETKILVTATVRHDPLPSGASVQLDMVPFSGASFSLPASAQPGSIGPKTRVSAGNQVGEAFHVIPILKRATTATKGPVLRRWTSRAQVVSVRQDQITVPIIWRTEVVSPTGDGTYLPLTLEAEWQYLKTMEAQGTAFTYQEGALTYTAFIDQVELKGEKWTDQRQMIEGLLFVKLLTVN